MKPKQKNIGVYKIGRNIATKNNTPGYRVNDERLIKKGRIEYREWDPFRSKLAAALNLGLSELPIREGVKVLYLGASSGTTASHIADITCDLVYCVEYSKRMMRDLLQVCMVKTNMIPILGDANKPLSYAANIMDVDVIYQDVAQKNQTEIFIKNMKYFKARAGMMAIKARSIDCTAPPKKIFKREVATLREEFRVLDTIQLAPFDKDHILVNLKTK